MRAGMHLRSHLVSPLGEAQPAAAVRADGHGEQIGAKIPSEVLLIEAGQGAGSQLVQPPGFEMQGGDYIALGRSSFNSNLYLDGLALLSLDGQEERAIVGDRVMAFF